MPATRHVVAGGYAEGVPEPEQTYPTVPGAMPTSGSPCIQGSLYRVHLIPPSEGGGRCATWARIQSFPRPTSHPKLLFQQGLFLGLDTSFLAGMSGDPRHQYLLPAAHLKQKRRFITSSKI